MLMVSLYWALTFGFYAAAAFAMWRVFQIGRGVSEIKKMLMEIRQNQSPPDLVNIRWLFPGPYTERPSVQSGPGPGA